MKHIILILSIAICGNLFGQTTILAEDFNDGFPAGWQLVDSDGYTPNASSAVNFIDDAFVVVEDYDTTGVGDSILVATSWFDTVAEADDWLILPNVTLGAFGNYISFDARSIDASHPDGLEIRVSTGGVDLWEFFTLDTVVYSNIAMAPEWTKYTISLDSVGNVANEDVFIAFRHLSTDNYILALDNIEVFVNDPVSVSENQVSEISFYPNPSDNGLFFVNGLANELYEVFDISGKLVASGNIRANQIDLSQLEAGSYFIKVGDYKPSQVILK
jgi:hypothetical protein